MGTNDNNNVKGTIFSNSNPISEISSKHVSDNGNKNSPKPLDIFNQINKNTKDK